MLLKRYGIEFQDGTQLVSLSSDDKHGWWFTVRGKRQEIEVRVTPSGLLRVSKPRKSGIVTADGPQIAKP